MEFNAFGFFVSVINFGLMAFLFYFVVIASMEDAVAVRQRKIQARLDDIRKTLTTAQRMESDVQTQFAGLEAEKQEMRASTDREIARITRNIEEQAVKDAEHMVAKTHREMERSRQEALASLNKELADRAMVEVETILARAFDAQAREASAQGVLQNLVVNRG